MYLYYGRKLNGNTQNGSILRPTREVNHALPKRVLVDHLPPIRYTNNIGVGQHRSLPSIHMQETVYFSEGKKEKIQLLS